MINIKLSVCNFLMLTLLLAAIGQSAYAASGQYINETSIAAVKQTKYKLKVVKTKNGAVKSAPSKLKCSNSAKSCSAKFTAGSLVVLTPSPKKGMLFNGWGGDCSGTQPCNLLMNGDHTVTAAFVDKPTLKPADIVITASPSQPSSGEVVTVLTVVSGANLAGNISLFDGQSKLLESPIVNGQVVASLTFAEGSHPLTAVYTAIPSGYTVTSLPFNVKVRKPTPSMSLSIDKDPVYAGKPFTLQAILSGENISGSVVFKASGNSLATVPVDVQSSSASYTAQLPAGDYAIVAEYSGNDFNSPVTSNTLQRQVIYSPPVVAAIALTIDPINPFAEDNFTLTATVTGDQPTGRVYFRQDGNLMTLDPVALSAGVASITVRLPKGIYTFVTEYSGDIGNLSAISNPITVQVRSIWDGPPPSLTSLTTEPGIGYIVLRWSMPYTGDSDVVEVWASESNDRATAARIVESNGSLATYNPPKMNKTYYFWAKVKDNSGLYSDWYPISGSGITGWAVGL